MRPLLWIPMLALRVAGFLVGLFMVPLMYATRARPYWLFRPWLNPVENFSVPNWWLLKCKTSRNPLMRLFPRWYWNAVRNSTNGLRTYRWLTVLPDYRRVKHKGNGLPVEPWQLRPTGKRFGWFYAWQGPYAGLWVCIIWSKTKHAKIRWGWKLVPDESPYEDRFAMGLRGFAMSTLIWRKG
jgi:hypothetical protein